MYRYWKFVDHTVVQWYGRTSLNRDQLPAEARGPHPYKLLARENKNSKYFFLHRRGNFPRTVRVFQNRPSLSNAHRPIRSPPFPSLRNSKLPMQRTIPEGPLELRRNRIVRNSKEYQPSIFSWNWYGVGSKTTLDPLIHWAEIALK